MKDLGGALHDPDPRRRLEAAMSLAKEGDFSGLGVLAECLIDDVTEVRFRAASICEQIGFAGAAKELGRLAVRDPESENRNAAIYALAGVGRPAVAPLLIAVLKDDDSGCRQNARTALYRVLGEDILRLLAEDDADTPDPEEAKQLTAWWKTAKNRFEVDRVYYMGKPASPGLFIQKLKQTRAALPDAVLHALQWWTGEDFGQKPISIVVAKWEKWWITNKNKYTPGRRCFYGHPVP